MKKILTSLLVVAGFSVSLVSVTTSWAQISEQPLTVAPANSVGADTVSAAGAPACALEVSAASSVVGLTKKSGFAKFALGTLLPSVAGSVAGSGTGAGSFKAGRDLASQSSIAGNRATADKVSDVPDVIAKEYTEQRQSDAVNAIFANRPIKAMPAPAAGVQCQHIVRITGLTFEHSKDYKARNAIVVQSEFAEYRAGAKKPVISVFDETRTPLTTSPLVDEADAAALQSELAKALNGSINNLVDRFVKKQK